MAELTDLTPASTASSCCSTSAQETCCETGAAGGTCGCAAGEVPAAADDLRDAVRARYAAAALAAAEPAPDG